MASSGTPDFGKM